jgi:hypothetical protein
MQEWVMLGFLRELGRLPLILRCTLAGSISVSVVAGVVALIGALVEYPRTAWFALLEGGFLGAVAGAALGLLVGLACSMLAGLARRLARRA